MEEEIIEALSEWPVTNSVYDQTSPLDKIDNPHSVSAFFLRNVGKVPKRRENVSHSFKFNYCSYSEVVEGPVKANISDQDQTAPRAV